MARNIKLMIVDDIKDTRENLRRLLQFEEGIEIIAEAANGEEAVRQAKQIQPDIILMDINMPVMDGIEATERITLDLPQIGIIIISVQGEQEYLRKAMSAGARGYLIKPPSSDDLIRTIHHVYDMEQKRLQMLLTSEMAANKGMPFVISQPKTGITEAIHKLASNLAGIEDGKKEKSPTRGWRGFMRRR